MDDAPEARNRQCYHSLIFSEVTMNGLLHSRKFWLAVFGVVQALVFNFINVPEDVWQAIAALVAVLIASIAAEDAAEKRAGGGSE